MALTKVIGAGAEGLTLSSTSLTVANGLTLTDGNVTLASGHGINFAATSDAGGMASELLDDYEEGTFTPAYSMSSANTTIVGRYTRVGNMVTLFIKMQVTQTGSSTSLGKITGLPFTVDATASHGTVVFREYSTTGDLHAAGLKNGDTETFNLTDFTNGSTFSAGSDLGIGISISYKIDGA